MKKSLPLLALSLAGAVSTTACAPGNPGEEARELSCELDYLNERFGGLLFLIDRADEDGRFEHTYSAGAVASVGGEYDSGNGDFWYVQIFPSGYANLSRDVRGNAIFEENGDGTGISETVTYLADGSLRVGSGTSTRTGCVVSSTSIRDDGSEVQGMSENVSASEVVFSSTSIDPDDRIVTTEGAAYIDWTAEAHYEMEDPATAASPDYVEDRISDADGSATGSYEAWETNGHFTRGNAQYLVDGDVVRTWIRYTDDTATEVIADGVTTNHLDGSGESTFTRYDSGSPVGCVRSWDSEGSGTLACDDGTLKEF